MGKDFTSRKYPMFAGIIDESEEGHMEPGGEDIKSSVKGAEHPLFGTNQTVKLVNKLRMISNSIEPQLSGEAKEDTIKDMVKASFKNKFPVDHVLICADLKEDIVKRDGMSDADSIISDLTKYANEFKTATRDPKNFEVFMAYAVEGVGAAKNLIKKAESAPNDKAKPIGSKYDDIVFYKMKSGKKVLRTNKEVVQFFQKRMLNGTDFFPHLPLGRNANATN